MVSAAKGAKGDVVNEVNLIHFITLKYFDSGLFDGLMDLQIILIPYVWPEG